MKSQIVLVVLSAGIGASVGFLLPRSPDRITPSPKQTAQEPSVAREEKKLIVEGKVTRDGGPLTQAYHLQFIPEEYFRDRDIVGPVADEAWAIGEDGKFHCFLRPGRYLVLTTRTMGVYLVHSFLAEAQIVNEGEENFFSVELSDTMHNDDPRIPGPVIGTR